MISEIILYYSRIVLLAATITSTTASGDADTLTFTLLSFGTCLHEKHDYVLNVM